MSRQTLPYIFLTVLLLILVFILGMRYGKRVEQADKSIRYYLSITPPHPSPTVPLSFKTIEVKECGVVFLLPQSETAAVSCTTVPTLLPPDQKNATEEVVINGKKVIARSDDEKTYTMQFLHPKSGKTITASIKKNLLPLFTSSLKFMQ